jgi:amino acid efflux transporter
MLWLQWKSNHFQDRTTDQDTSGLGSRSLITLAVLVADSMGLLTIEGMLAIAGQNFFILYGLARVVLFRYARHPRERAVATLAILVVAGLLVAEGLFSLLYPAGLALFGIAVAIRRRMAASG